MKLLSKRILRSLVLFLFIPFVVQADASDWTVTDLIKKVTEYATYVFSLLFGILFVLFLWNGTQFLLSGHETEDVGKAKAKLTVGVIALFVLISIWGLVAIVDNFVLK